MADQLNDLKKQEDILKTLISKLEDQKQRLQIEETDLVCLLEKPTTLNEHENEQANQSQPEVTTNTTTNQELNLDPNLKFNPNILQSKSNLIEVEEDDD